MSGWYIEQEDGRSQGPFTPAQMKRLAESGKLRKTDVLRKDGGNRRYKAGSIAGLFSDSQAPNPPQVEEEEEDDDEIKLEVQEQESAPRVRIKRGVKKAKGILKAGTDRLRATFGGAMQETISTGFTAFGELITQPIRYAFATLVLIIACALCVPGLLTMLLIPVFILGYMLYVKALLNKEPATLAFFIGFMRHGWDALWHLLMLLGTFFLATALAIAPFLIAIVIGYAAFGTLGFGGMQVSALLSSDTPRNQQQPQEEEEVFVPPGMERFRQQRGIQGFDPRGVERGADGFFFHLWQAVASLGKSAVWVLTILVSGVVLTILLTPSGAIMVLIYCISLMVATRPINPEARYDLVFQAFSSMLSIASNQWKRLITNGLWLVAIPVMAGVATILATGVLSEVRLYFLGMWVNGVLVPILSLGFVVYVNVFSVLTATQLVDDLEATEKVSAQMGETYS